LVTKQLQVLLDAFEIVFSMNPSTVFSCINMQAAGVTCPIRATSVTDSESALFHSEKALLSAPYGPLVVARVQLQLIAEHDTE
jgi:hypothetical protein